MKLNSNFLGEGVQKKPSMGVVEIFYGTAQCSDQ